MSFPYRATLIAAILAVLVAGCGSQLVATPTPEATAPLPTIVLPTARATAASQAGYEQWDTAPPLTIDPDAHYLATFKTAKGDIVVELLADKAPFTVNNFIFLARAGYYDNTTFHRVLRDFMAQGGDPTGTGSGSPGYRFPDEFYSCLTFNEPGLLAMANSGANTNGSQFFITFGPTPHLDFKHTIFGKVVEGMDVALALRLRDPQVNPDFDGDVLNTVEITEIPESRLPPSLPALDPNDQDAFANLAPAERAVLYCGAPSMVIDETKAYTATLTTTKGDIVVQLHADQSPQSVNNFVVLARLGYYDDFPFAYADPTRFALSGSPGNVPTSDIGYTIPTETALPNTTGAVGMWFRQELGASSGSQFYILLDEEIELPATFSVFGTVVDGLDIAGTLTVEDSIETITIEEH